jgi:UDP-GlcNAc:undecaprenyl-phosphate/decaprenyl-phosphate GlcNAc-1-phosphate transferase
MNHLMWTAFQAFGFSLILTPVFRDIFRSYKVVDQPDLNRKIHAQPIPRVGGIGIAIAYALAFYLAGPDAGGPVAREMSLVANILPAAALIFVTGLLDDFIGLKPWHKIVGQVIAALLVWSMGVRLSGVAGHALPEAATLILTVGWLLVCTNAFNLVDGLDGLAAGVGMFATLTIFTAAAIDGNQPLMFATLPLAGCLLGFLCFNFNPATVFLGDCGSLLIGFMLGCFGLIWTGKTVTLLGLTAPLMAFSVPLIDVTLCVARRWLRNQPIFSADRGHIHHKLLDRGLSPRQAVLLLYALCGVTAAFSLLQSRLQDVYVAAAVVVVFGVVAVISVRRLRYAEFMLAGQMLRAGEFQRSVSAKIHLSSFEAAILKARNMDECWQAILSMQQPFGFAAIRIWSRGVMYESGPAPSTARFWTMHLPLNSHDYIELTREFGSPVLPTVVVPFAELVASTLAEKLNGEDMSALSTQAAAAVRARG